MIIDLQLDFAGFLWTGCELSFVLGIGIFFGVCEPLVSGDVISISWAVREASLSRRF